MKKLLSLSLAIIIVFGAIAIVACGTGEKTVKGDINGNGGLDAMDYFILKRGYFGTYDLTDEQLAQGDINGNGEFDVMDYTLLKRAYFAMYDIVDEENGGETSDTTSGEDTTPVMGDVTVSLGKTYTVSKASADNYSDAYNSELTNGVASGVYSYNNSELAGFSTRNLQIVIDLEKAQSGIHTISSSHYLDNVAGVSSSLGFTVAYSSDYSNWTEIGKLAPKGESKMGQLNASELKLSQEITARYIRFTIIGDGAWIFLDELSVVAYTEVEESIDYSAAIEKTYSQLGTITPVKGENDIKTELLKNCISSGAPYTIDRPANSKYPDVDGIMLTDGTVQTLYEHGCWVGFDGGEDVTVTLDLQTYATDIASIEIICLSKQHLGIYHPTAFDFKAMDENGNETVLGRLYASLDYEEGRKNFVFSVGKTFRARYLEITMHTIEDALHFIGEISVYSHRVESTDDLYPTVNVEEEGTPWENPSEDYVNLIYGKPCQILLSGAVSKTQFASNTPISSPLLTDGVFSNNYDIHNGKFFKFCQGDKRNIIFDLEHISAVEKFTIGFCHMESWGVYAPTRVGIILSEDGVDWYNVGEIPITATQYEGIHRGEMTLEVPLKARYVVFSVPVVTWVGIDEVEAFGTQSIENAESPKDNGITVHETVNIGKRKEPSPDLLGGAEHLCLLYHSKDAKSYDVDALLPYLAYVDKDKNIKDTMFDSFLFLYSTGDMPSGGSAYQNSVKSDWEWCINDLFKSGANLDALEETAGLVKDTLGLAEDFKYNVTMTIYYPGPEMTNFGDVDGDGISDDFTVAANRMKAIKWYVEEIEKRFEEKGYKNIQLVGYYWWHESINQYEEGIKELLNDISDYLHSIDRDFFWIPYHCAAGFSSWESYGFDIACMQPNYVFKSETPYAVLQNNEKYTKIYGMGFEMEIDEASLGDKLFFKKYMEYITLGAETGYMTDTVNMYYQGFSTFKKAAESNELMARTVYDTTYHYIKGDLQNVPETLDTYHFQIRGNKIYEGDLGFTDEKLREFKVSALPEHGTVIFCDDGRFYYFPEKDYVGEVKFTFVYNEYLSWSQPCEIVIDVQ